MKKIALVLFSFCLAISVSAQWTQFPGVPAGANIECIRTTDALHYYAGTTNAIFTTADAGASWQTVLVNDMTGNIIPSIITDVYFLNATDAIAVGWIALGNSEVILRTTNGGLNWTYANTYNGGTYPREQNALDFTTATTGYSVGSNGRILKTNNSGVSWFQLSTGITTELFDVDFTGAATGYAVGNGKILRTTNGSTWSSSTFTGKVFKGVHFPSAAVGYAAGDAGVVYKTSNSGASWTQLTITDPNVNFTSVFFTDDNTGYITSDHYIYHTTTGGQYWERIQMPDDMNGITFLNAQDGLACGDNSQLYHTSNAGLPYKPQPNFSVSPALLCYDSTVNLTNLSDPNWTFEWLLNGVPFSTAFSASLVVPDAGTNVISLVAFNGFERDTLSKNILIQPSLDIDLSIGVVGEICAGTSGQVQVFNSELGASYRLRNGIASIGLAQAGNGGTLTFSTGNLSATTTLNIRATKSNTCGFNEVVEYVDVVVQNPDINKVIYADPAPICPNLSTSVFLELSQSGVTYQLMNGTTVVGAIQTGNGGTLSFPTPVLTANTTYVIRGTSSPLGCITNFPALTVVVEYPTLYFSPTNLNPEVNESIAFVNNTVNPGGTYTWNFGPDATPQFFTGQNVSSVQFGTTGIHPVTLTVTTLGGCVSQLTKQVNVIDSVAAEACRVVHYDGNHWGDHGRIYALTRDQNRNLYTFYKHNATDSISIYTGNGDMIVNTMPILPNYDEFYSLTKHTEKGVPMWSTRVSYGTTWSRAGDVVTDSAGNVYTVHHHGDHLDSMRIYSADGRYITIDPPFNGSSSIIIKYDPNGMYLWHTGVQDTYGVERISLKLDESGNLLYGGTYFYKIAPNGTVLNSAVGMDSEPDGQGGVYVCGTGFGYQYIGPGTGIPSPAVTPVILPGSNTYITTSYIQMDEDHNIYLVGDFHGGFIFNGVLYSDAYLGGSPHDGIFLCRINSDGSPGWLKHFKSDYTNDVRGFDIKNGQIVLAMQTYAHTYINVGGPVLTGLSGFRSEVLFKCNADGDSANMIVFQNGSVYEGYIIPFDLVHLSDDGTEVDLGFEFKNSFTTPSGVPVTALNTASFAGSAVQLASVDCLFSIVEEPPVSAFTSDSTVCTETEITFTDASTNVPDSWNWTFQNGTPAVSTDQNPEVSFGAPGTYTVTLTASNQYGVGTTTTQQITVTEAADISNWISEDSLCYSENGTSVEAPLYGGGTYTYSNNSFVTNNTFFPSTGAIGAYTLITYYYTDPAVGCAGEAADSIFTMALPVVTLTSFASDTICYENQGIPLGAGLPSGGIFTDNYNSIITGNNLFPPANALNSSLVVYYSYTDPAGCAGIDSAAIYLDECAGLALSDLSQEVPKLATLVNGLQYQVIDADAFLEGTVMDSKGQKVLDFKKDDIIDLEPFSPGMYLIRFTSGMSNHVFKVNRY